MTVATYTAPDYTTQSASAYKAAIDGGMSVHHRIGGSFAGHEQSTPAMTVRVDAGAILASAALTEVAAQSTGTITAPGSNSRIDRVVIDSTTGTVSVITGVASASPAIPALTAGKLPVCRVLLTSSSTAITNSMITDERSVVAAPPTAAPPMRSYLAGCKLSTAGSSTTMSIAAGTAVDSTNAYAMALAAIAKTTSAWAVGSGNGGLDTGAIAANTWYHWYGIMRPDTSVVDVICSLNASAPTLPANYTVYRRIGSGKTNGSSQWTSFIQDGDLFQWLDPVLDYDSGLNPGTAALTVTLPSVPLGLNVLSLTNVSMNSGGAGEIVGYASDLATTDVAPSTTAAPLGNGWGSSGGVGFDDLEIRTNTSQQFRFRINVTTGGTRVYIATKGWIDTRGREA